MEYEMEQDACQRTVHVKIDVTTIHKHRRTHTIRPYGHYLTETKIIPKIVVIAKVFYLHLCDVIKALWWWHFVLVYNFYVVVAVDCWRCGTQYSTTQILYVQNMNRISNSHSYTKNNHYVCHFENIIVLHLPYAWHMLVCSYTSERVVTRTNVVFVYIAPSYHTLWYKLLLL